MTMLETAEALVKKMTELEIRRKELARVESDVNVLEKSVGELMAKAKSFTGNNIPERYLKTSEGVLLISKHECKLITIESD